MIDPELQALALAGPAGVLAVLGMSLLAVAFALALLIRAIRIQRLMAAEFAALNRRLAAAEDAAAARAEALHSALPGPPPPTVDPAEMMALTEAVRSVSAAVARIDRQMGDVRLQVRTLHADTGARLDEVSGSVQGALSGYERLMMDMVTRALAAAAPAPAPAPAADAGARPPDAAARRDAGDPVPRERVPEPFRRPVPRPAG